MQYFIVFLLAFAFVYIIYLLLVVLNKKGRARLKNGMEAKFLVNVYKVNILKVTDKRFAHTVAFCNSFILATTFLMVTLFFDNFILQIALSFVVLIVLIIIVYSIIGKRYKKIYG